MSLISSTPLSRAASRTAFMSALPIPLSWRSGSTVIGPTPATGSVNEIKFEPTGLPPKSAATPWKSSREARKLMTPSPASSVGKSLSKACLSWTDLKASKHILPSSFACSGDTGTSASSSVILSAVGISFSFYFLESAPREKFRASGGNLGNLWDQAPAPSMNLLSSFFPPFTIGSPCAKRTASNERSFNIARKDFTSPRFTSSGSSPMR